MARRTKSLAYSAGYAHRDHRSLRIRKKLGGSRIGKIIRHRKIKAIKERESRLQRYFDETNSDKAP